jgi:hypothetical protein
MTAWTEPSVSTWYGTLLTFLADGIWHVAIGYDHIGLRAAAAAASVLHGSRSGWTAATSLRDVAADLARIVTAFTVAHSITLALAATGTVHVPEKPIEVAIAGSIVVAGLLNLFPSGAVGGCDSHSHSDSCTDLVSRTRCVKAAPARCVCCRCSPGSTSASRLHSSPSWR